MRVRRLSGTEAEIAALEEIPEDLVQRCFEASETSRWPTGLRCEVLDAYDAARLLGATRDAIVEMLYMSSTYLTRWRRQRVVLMTAAEGLLRAK